MKFTLSWLKEHLDTDAPVEAIADKLTMIGLEVESLADKATLLAPFTIARVIEAKQHPNADRLRVCMVDTGKGDPVQVVCGAPNAKSGMMGVFVPPGAYIPGKDITLGVGKIRGVESHGMLVSEMEMQLSEDHEGIIELPADAPLGEVYAKWAGLDDPVIEIKLTPNRPDCTGVHGVARDLAAADMGKFIDKTVEAGERHRRLPARGQARLRHDAVALPRLCAAPGARREERPVAGLAAEAPHRDRAAADQCAGRHHQLHHLRPRPAAARVRRRQGEGQSRGAARQAGRAVAGARRQDLHPRRHHVRDRRRGRPGIARRHHGRRGVGLRREHHRRADRVGAVGAAQHRADRPQARHQFGRALPLRARRRSGVPGAGARARDARWCSTSAAARRRRSRSPAIRRCRSW